MTDTSTNKCNKCGQIKGVDQFLKNKTKRGYSNRCKECHHILCKKYREENTEKIKALQKKYSLENSEKNKKRCRDWWTNNPDRTKKYYQENRDKILARGKSYNLKNKDKRSENFKKWREKNKDARSKYVVEYYSNRLKSDPVFKLIHNIRTRLNRAIKTKKTSVTIELLGCTKDYFKGYFESKFIKGMTWDKFMNGEIHVDHIIPCASFDLSIPEQQERCFHYTNLQPLWAKDNLKKNKYIKAPIQLTLI